MSGAVSRYPFGLVRGAEQKSSNALHSCFAVAFPPNHTVTVAVKTEQTTFVADVLRTRFVVVVPDSVTTKVIRRPLTGVAVGAVSILSYRFWE